jgi:competence protein ComEC
MLLLLVRLFFATVITFYTLDSWAQNNKPDSTIITGVISDYDRKGSFLKLYIDIHNLGDNIIKARVSCPCGEKKIVSGTKIRTRATLEYPSPPPHPDGFDWQGYLYKKGVTLTGFTWGKPYQLQLPKKPTFWQQIQLYRLDAIARIRDLITDDRDVFAVMVALSFGERGYIRPKSREMIQDAGIAHILAISGLHMGMVTGAMFYLVLRVLALFTIHAKSIAAIIAILTATTYLLISGLALPTQRAYGMTMLVFIGILTQRKVISIRSLLIMALVLLGIDYENFYSAGFQLSFLAVLSIIIFGNWWSKNAPRLIGNNKLLLWALGLFISSIVITIITAPIVAWHFHKIPIYGALANLITIPIMGFWVMPTLLIGMFSDYGLILASKGISVILYIADYISGLEHSVWQTGMIDLFMLIFSLGAILCLMLAKGYYKYLAVPLLLTSLLFISPKPDILISYNGKHIGLIAADRLTVLQDDRSRFTINVWSKAYAIAKANITVEPLPNDMGIYHFNDYTLAIINDESYIRTTICEDYDYIINLTNNNHMHCENMIGRINLQEQGSHAIYHQDNKILTDHDFRGGLPWAKFQDRQF